MDLTTMRRAWRLANPLAPDEAETLAELARAFDEQARRHPIRGVFHDAAWFLLSCDRLGLTDIHGR